LKQFKSLFNLRHDQDDNSVIHNAIRAGERDQAERAAPLQVSVAQCQSMARNGAAPAPVLLMTLAAKLRLRDSDIDRIRAGIAMRFADTFVELVQPPQRRRAQP
jgi:hypothetical protein